MGPPVQRFPQDDGQHTLMPLVLLVSYTSLAVEVHLCYRSVGGLRNSEIAQLSKLPACPRTLNILQQHPAYVLGPNRRDHAEALVSSYSLGLGFVRFYATLLQ